MSILRSVFLILIGFFSTPSFGADDPNPCADAYRAALRNTPRLDGKIFSKIVEAPSPELRGAVIITLSDIQRALKKSPRKIWPPIDPIAHVYFDHLLSPFNSYGSAGSIGALGEHGPVGRSIWNPSRLISDIYWRPWARYLQQNGGPLSEHGPLGDGGSMGRLAYRWGLLSFGSTGKHMQEGGVLSFFGPKSGMGPAGILGPLGGTGSHGYIADPITGQFKEGQRLVHEVRVDTGSQIRTFRLEENLSEEGAETLSRQRALDASFVVDDHISGPMDEYFVNLRKGTLPEFRVISSDPRDRFSIELLSDDGVSLATSDSRDFSTNIIQMKAPADTSVKVRIRYLGKRELPRGYRLIATEPFAAQEDLGFDGPHMTIFR